MASLSSPQGVLYLLSCLFIRFYKLNRCTIEKIQTNATNERWIIPAFFHLLLRQPEACCFLFLTLHAFLHNDHTGGKLSLGGEDWMDDLETNEECMQDKNKVSWLQGTRNFLWLFFSSPKASMVSARTNSRNSRDSPPRFHCSWTAGSTWHLLVFALISHNLRSLILRASWDITLVRTIGYGLFTSHATDRTYKFWHLFHLLCFGMFLLGIEWLHNSAILNTFSILVTLLPDGMTIMSSAVASSCSSNMSAKASAAEPVPPVVVDSAAGDAAGRPFTGGVVNWSTRAGAGAGTWFNLASNSAIFCSARFRTAFWSTWPTAGGAGATGVGGSTTGGGGEGNASKPGGGGGGGGWAAVSKKTKFGPQYPLPW